MRVLFVHGLESSPQGTKAVYLSERFEALTPAMQTGDFLGCLAQQREAIASFRPDVVVGSSFGGAVVLRLMHDGDWSGPTLLLAQAAVRFGVAESLPLGASALLVHGTRDEVIDVADSRLLAVSGDPERTRLEEVDDAHHLKSLTDGERLAELVREAYQLHGGHE